MGILNHASLPKMPLSEYMLGDGEEIDKSNIENWSDTHNVLWWLAHVISKQPEVERMVYVKNWGQGDYHIDFILTDGTPVTVYVPDSDTELYMDEDENDNDEGNLAFSY
jgi:hypothetical protein